MAEISDKSNRRKTALIGLIVVGILIGVLLYLEQIAILYVLATITLVALLLVVGFSDLEKVGRENTEGFAPRD